jgi:hypothetical protein
MSEETAREQAEREIGRPVDTKKRADRNKQGSSGAGRVNDSSKSSKPRRTPNREPMPVSKDVAEGSTSRHLSARPGRHDQSAVEEQRPKE